MQTLPAHLDRLGAALRALRLRQTHAASGGDRLSLGAECLGAVIRELADEGLAKEDLQPLVDLEAELRKHLAPLAATPSTATPKALPGERERRRGRPPSEEMLGRVAAVIDLLVKAGYDEAHAAQLLTRKLLAAGVSPPLQGGDARGWKRLLFWRADLSFGLASPEAKDEYRAFTRELETIPANERVKRVLDGQLWDRRHRSGAVSGALDIDRLERG
jgi:hypothetical protein